jgi:hypothetical protein
MKGAKEEVETVPCNLSAGTFHFMGQGLYGGDRRLQRFCGTAGRLD